VFDIFERISILKQKKKIKHVRRHCFVEEATQKKFFKTGRSKKLNNCFPFKIE
jgi:hypothetical protein